jgi:acyl-CoA reductase-like NAD-dependent aldehyde dehydrogenase
MGSLAVLHDIGHLIDGKIDTAGERFAVIDPATGEPFADCPMATRDVVERALAAARRAYPTWRDTPVGDRRAILSVLADRLDEAADRLAPLLSREQGKPVADARAEFARAARAVRELCQIDISDGILREDERGRIEMRHRPLGVAVGIVPWNAPVVLAMHKVAHALYTGNCLVLKPSPYTPLATLAIGALATEVFPAGVLNIVAGGNDVGAYLVAHPDVDKVSFTGSVASGRKVMASAGEGLKRVTLELGGNDPAIVLADADLDLAAAGIVRSAFANCGQICMAVKRVYVADALFQPFVAKVTMLAEAIKIGPGCDPASRMGPLQNKMQFDKVTELIARTRETPGATFHTGGEPVGEPGYFVRPAIVTGLADDAALVTEEQFGPVLPILRFDDVDHAVRRANATRLGLSASVWSADVERAAAIARRIDAGTVWVNRHGGGEADVPFGGAKDSGIGREQGLYGLRSYMEMQIVTVPA